MRLYFLTFHTASLRSALDAFLRASEGQGFKGVYYYRLVALRVCICCLLRVSTRITSLLAVAAVSVAAIVVVVVVVVFVVVVVVVVVVVAERGACLEPLTSYWLICSTAYCKHAPCTFLLVYAMKGKICIRRYLLR